jgi:hypothetical protein
MEEALEAKEGSPEENCIVNIGDMLEVFCDNDKSNRNNFFI